MKHRINEVTFDPERRVNEFEIQIENDSDVNAIMQCYVGMDRKIRITSLYRETAASVPNLLQALAYFAAHEGFILWQVEEFNKPINAVTFKKSIRD